MPLDVLISQQQTLAKEHGRELTEEEAFEEVIANALEGVMADGKVAQFLQQLEGRNKRLGARVRRFFHDIAQMIRDTLDAYAGVMPDSVEGIMISQLEDTYKQPQKALAEGIYDAGETFRQAEKNSTGEGGVRYQARRLKESDLDAYLNAGSRRNINKVKAIENGESIILTTEEEIVDFINKSIEKKAGDTAVAYGRVNDRLANTVYAESKGKISIDDYYLELIPTDLQHAYEQHGKAKMPGDIDLSREDFQRIPEYLDSFTEVLYAIKYNSGQTRICVSKKLENGRILIIETVSKSRGSIQLKNAIGVSEEKYEKEYLSTYKKRAGMNTGESNSSNNTPRDITDSNKSIRNPDGIVNSNSTTDSDGNRFSVRQKQNPTVADMLKKEVEKLKGDVEKLKELLKLQRSITGGTKFTASSVEAAARVLKKSAGATGNTVELASLLNRFYEYIATERELTWEGVKEQAAAAADWLQEHVKHRRSDYAQEILDQLHGSRIYLDESQKQEAAHRFGSFNAFRQAVMGSITVANEGDTSLDSFWQEMSALYPDVFDGEMTAGDMPGALADVIDRLRNEDTSLLEYAYNRDMIRQDLVRQVYDTYWNVSTLRTFSDVKQAQINRLKSEHLQRMQQMKAENREKVEALKESHRAEVEMIRNAYRQRLDTQQKEISCYRWGFGSSSGSNRRNFLKF